MLLHVIYFYFIFLNLMNNDSFNILSEANKDDECVNHQLTGLTRNFWIGRYSYQCRR